ncbi:MAG: lipoprotein [Oscillospiraceae bacterium]|nr:lipoprotein [Oscillospiraceae bacterium]
MKKYIAILIAVLLLSGCTAAPSVTTEPPVETTAPPVTAAPPETTLPPETTVPMETTLPSETTVPVETTVPIDPTEAEIRAVVDEFLTAYEENCYLYTDHEYDHLTVLAADPDATVTIEGKAVKLSSFHKNIEFLHDKETYWKYVRQAQGISRHSYASTCHFDIFDFDGDSVKVTATLGMSWVYSDAPTGKGSGSFEDFELLLVCVDGTWLVADALELWSAFDGQYKNNPDFDVDELIAEFNPS